MGGIFSSPRSNEDLAKEIVELQKKTMEKDYPDPKDTKRDAHPKTVGLVTAEFEISPDVPQEVRVGLFANVGTTYPCWVRFSNANPEPQSDLIPDKRGCAIKLLSPAGDDSEINQDFVLMNTPIMPLGTPQLFRDVIYYSQVSFYLLAVKLMFKCQLHKFLKFLSFRTVTESMLGESFHSTTPYAFGDNNVVKYGLFPTTYKGPSIPKRIGFEYLTIELQEALEIHSAKFDFCVQLQKDKHKQPIEDAAVLWDDKLSPFIKVATLTIPPQLLATPERFEKAEQLRFDMSHTFPEHKPLGGLNIVRAIVYKELSEFRLKRAGRLV